MLGCVVELAAVASEITVAEIVGQDVDDVGACRVEHRRRKDPERRDQQDVDTAHVTVPNLTTDRYCENTSSRCHSKTRCITAPDPLEPKFCDWFYDTKSESSPVLSANVG